MLQIIGIYVHENVESKIKKPENLITKGVALPTKLKLFHIHSIALES